MRKHLRRVTAALACTLALALIACDPNPGRSSSPRSQTSAGAAVPGAHPGPQPFDIFRGDDLGAVDYAVLVLRNDCMAKAGFPQLRDSASPRRTTAFRDLLITAADLGPTSEADARDRGFGRDMPAEPARVWSKDANFSASSDRCEAQAWKAIGATAQQTYMQYFDLGNKLLAGRGTVLEAVPPKDMAEQIADCMQQGGFRVPNRASWVEKPDIKAFGVSFGNLREPPEASWAPTGKGVVEIGPAVPARKYVPTQDESRLAVAWYRCTTRAGWPQRQMDKVIAAQSTLVKQYESQFDELNPQIEALAKRATELAGHG